MKLNKNTFLIIIFWTLVALILAFLVWGNITSDFKSTRSLLLYTSVIQRVTALLGLVLLTTQIVLGAFMKPMKDKLGSQIINIHINYPVDNFQRKKFVKG